MEKNYSYVQVPTNLLYLLDSYCYHTIALLIQEESYWKSKGKLSNGYFIKPIEEISNILGFANDKDTRLTLEALYRAGFIRIQTEIGKRKPAKFSICWDKIEMLAEKTITDILKFEEKISKLGRKELITYCSTEPDTNCHTKCSTNCTPTIDNIDKTDNIENIDKLNNIDKRKYLVNNIFSDSSNSFDRSKNEEAKPIDDSSISSNERNFDSKVDELLYPTTQVEKEEPKPQPQIPSYDDIPFGDTEALKDFIETSLDLVAQASCELITVPHYSNLYDDVLKAYRELNNTDLKTTKAAVWEKYNALVKEYSQLSRSWAS